MIGLVFKRVQLCAATVIFLSSLMSCQNGDELSVGASEVLLTGNYGSAGTRGYWEEDQSIKSGLAFHWQNSVDGYEDLIITMVDPDSSTDTEGGRLYEFNNSEHYTYGKVRITTNPLVSQISMLNQPINSMTPGDEIYSYVPVQGKEEILASLGNMVVTMIIPRVMRTNSLNSTKHLSPYLFMAGKGVLNKERNFLTSDIKYQVLPAVFRLRINNQEKNTPFTPQLVRIYGDFSSVATVKLVPGSSSSDTQENIIYSSGTKLDLNIENQTIGGGESANSYLLAFPTDMDGKRFLVELHGLYGDKKTVRTAYVPAGSLTEVKSNTCYTFQLNIAQSSFEVGGITSNPWTGDGEAQDIVTTPESSL